MNPRRRRRLRTQRAERRAFHLLESERTKRALAFEHWEPEHRSALKRLEDGLILDSIPGAQMIPASVFDAMARQRIRSQAQGLADAHAMLTRRVDWGKP